MFKRMLLVVLSISGVAMLPVEESRMVVVVPLAGGQTCVAGYVGALMFSGTCVTFANITGGFCDAEDCGTKGKDTCGFWFQADVNFHSGSCPTSGTSHPDNFGTQCGKTVLSPAIVRTPPRLVRATRTMDCGSSEGNVIKIIIKESGTEVARIWVPGLFCANC